jgi:hypothetical protein
MLIFAVHHQSPDYHSRPEPARAFFSTKDEAMKYALDQPGYGFGIDWFVKEIEVLDTYEKPNPCTCGTHEGTAPSDKHFLGCQIWKTLK